MSIDFPLKELTYNEKIVVITMIMILCFVW